MLGFGAFFIVRNLFTLPEHTRLPVDIQWHSGKIIQKEEIKQRVKYSSPIKS